MASDCVLSPLEPELLDYFYSQMRSQNFLLTRAYAKTHEKSSAVYLTKLLPCPRGFMSTLTAQSLKQVRSTLAMRSNRSKKAHFLLTYDNKNIKFTYTTVF